MIRIAVDAHGGDNGCATVVEGVLAALTRSTVPISVYLCGRRDEIDSAISSLGGGEFVAAGSLLIENCSDDVSDDCLPSKLWKRHPNAPVVRCLSMQKDGLVSASLSAGDTRYIIGSAIFLLGHTSGISRPALAAFLPTAGARPVLLLDVGANVECKPRHLADFGTMGREYFGHFFGIENPKVALLNVGGESFKGSKVVRDTADILRQDMPDSFCGFVEGSQVLSGSADVVVCDGFAGNVLLKACESFHNLVERIVGTEDRAAELVRARVSVLNADNYGAVPLLGVNGVVFKAHGASSPRAICHAVNAAAIAASQKTADHAFGIERI